MYRDDPNTVVYIFPPHEVQNVSRSPGSFSDEVKYFFSVLRQVLENRLKAGEQKSKVSRLRSLPSLYYTRCSCNLISPRPRNSDEGRTRSRISRIISPACIRPLVTRIDRFCLLLPWSDRNQFYNKYSNLPCCPMAPNGAQNRLVMPYVAHL